MNLTVSGTESTAIDPTPYTDEPLATSPAAPLSTHQTTGWGAVVDWYGPYPTKERCANAAAEAHEKFGLPDFGLYMAIGRLKRWSRMPTKILYIGKNGDDAALTLAQRIRNSGGLTKIEKYKGRATYWFGLLMGPALGREKSDEAERTERALIHSLRPVLNIKGLSSPEFRFAILNKPPKSRFGADRNGSALRNFRTLVPLYCELRPHLPEEAVAQDPSAPKNGVPQFELIWADGRGAIERWARGAAVATGWPPDPYMSKPVCGYKKVWQPFFSERLISRIENIYDRHLKASDVEAGPYPPPPLPISIRLRQHLMAAVIFMLTGALAELLSRLG